MCQECGNRKAPEGHIYICTACGRTSSWRYGFDDKGDRTSDGNWDESCTMKCELVTSEQAQIVKEAFRDEYRGQAAKSRSRTDA